MTRRLTYRLQGTEVILCKTDEEEQQAWGDKNRQLFSDNVGDSYISTVFLVIDHSFRGPPLHFETMAFGGPLDDEVRRYETFEEAERGHKSVVLAAQSHIALEYRGNGKRAIEELD